jgi:hypothetical protein
MSIDEGQSARLEVVGSVLIRALAVGVGLLLVWFLLSLCCTDFIISIHGPMYGVTKEQFLLISYVGMALMKIHLFLFFLAPYIAIRWVLAGKSEKA